MGSEADSGHRSLLNPCAVIEVPVEVAVRCQPFCVHELVTSFIVILLSRSI